MNLIIALFYVAMWVTGVGMIAALPVLLVIIAVKMFGGKSE